MDLDGIDVIFKQATIDELMMSVISTSPFGFDQYNKFFGELLFWIWANPCYLGRGSKRFFLKDSLGVEVSLHLHLRIILGVLSIVLIFYFIS